MTDSERKSVKERKREREYTICFNSTPTPREEREREVTCVRVCVCVREICSNWNGLVPTSERVLLFVVVFVLG